MDAETRQYMDEKFAEIRAAMEAWFSRLEQPQSGATMGELEDRVLSLEERFRTLQMRMDMFERRTDDRLHTVNARSRL